MYPNIILANGFIAFFYEVFEHNIIREICFSKFKPVNIYRVNIYRMMFNINKLLIFAV